MMIPRDFPVEKNGMAMGNPGESLVPFRNLTPPRNPGLEEDEHIWNHTTMGVFSIIRGIRLFQGPPLFQTKLDVAMWLIMGK